MDTLNDKYLRICAEYDNFRKRSQKEKDNLYTEIKAETVEKFLPVYDNLERALAQQTADEAFKKGVEMTMTQLTGIFEKLGVTAFGEALERVCVQTVEEGKMTKDLALLVGGDQDFLSTEEFLDAIDANLKQAMAAD